MTVLEFIEETWLAYKGKKESKTPVFGSEDANKVLKIGNRKVGEYARDSKVHRSSCFQIKTIGTIDTATDTYNLDADFISPSGEFFVVKTTGDKAKVTLAKPEKREHSDAYIWGLNPRKVTFDETINPSLDGGTFKAPGYYMPPKLVNSTDVIPVDDPNWLVYATAAELARNDTSKQDEYPNLLGQANDLYSNMAETDDDLGFNQGNTLPYSVTPIGDQSDDNWTV